MDRLVFQGMWLGTVDAKGRMSIPASFRDVVQARSGDRTVTLSPHHGDWSCLEGRDTVQIGAINRAATERYAPDQSSVEEDYARMDSFGMNKDVQYEDTGRIVLPADLRDYAEIEDMVLLIGMGDRFQVWNPDRFLDEAANEKMKKFARAKLKAARAK